MSDDPADQTKREGPARKWMAPTVGADTLLAPQRPTVPPSRALSVFDPPEQRFVERGELGRGGMGRVVEAVDRALDRAVAIKQSLAVEPVDLARFEREVRITAQLQHPSVIPILDVGRDPDGKPFYIMRKIEGEPLADRVEAAATVRDRVALISSFLGAVDAAAYAHARRIIHRDIKPWNILLGPFGETLLIDWGIARELDDANPEQAGADGEDTHALTRLGATQGTPGFLAPEQARGELVDARADVYSLGATLYHLLTNQLPFGRIPATQAIALASSGTSPDFGLISDEVPRELTAIVIKAMAPDRADRYADAGELAADLRRFLAGQLVVAHAYSARERLVKWVRRHKLAVSVGAIAVLVVAVVSTLSLRQVLLDRDAARASEARASERADAARAAEQAATDQADQNLIDRARSLLASDPTSAVALLRELREGSRYWPTAREITRAAVRGGVERRVGAASETVKSLAFAPGQLRLAWGTTSAIAVRELATSVVREYPVSKLVDFAWWGDEVIACRSAKAITIIDLASGTTRALDLEARALEIWEGALVVLGADGSVRSFDRTLGSRVLIDRGASALGVRGDWLAAISPARLWLIEPTRSRSWPVQGLVSEVVISGDRTRIAALGAGVVREWTVADTLAQPREWQRPKNGLNNIAYVEDRLVGWSSTGSGFVELADPPIPMWTVAERKPGTLRSHIMPFDHGALLVTDHGALALATSLGVIELAHRKMMVVEAAIAWNGMQIAIGLIGGEVLLLDLAHALPRTVPVRASTKLVGIIDGKAILRDFQDPFDPAPPRDPPGALAISGTAILDHRTGALMPVSPRTDGLWVTKGLIVGANPKQFYVWNDRGELIVEVGAGSMQVADGVMYWLDRDSKLWSRTLQPLGAPILIAHYPAYRTYTAPLDARPWLVLSAVIEGHLIGVRADDQRPVELTARGVVELPAGPGQHRVVGRLGGVWWTRGVVPPSYDERRLWRGTQALTLDHPVDGWTFFADRVWAHTLFGGQERIALTELDPAGKPLRRLDLPADSSPTATASSVLITDLSDVVELTPVSEVRSHLLAPGRLEHLLSSQDRTLLIGMLESRTGQKQLAYWADPVPADPTALRAFLDRLTNARVIANSSGLRFE